MCLLNGSLVADCSVASVAVFVRATVLLGSGFSASVHRWPKLTIGGVI